MVTIRQVYSFHEPRVKFDFCGGVRSTFDTNTLMLNHMKLPFYKIIVIKGTFENSENVCNRKFY